MANYLLITTKKQKAQKAFKKFKSFKDLKFIVLEESKIKKKILRGGSINQLKYQVTDYLFIVTSQKQIGQTFLKNMMTELCVLRKSKGRSENFRNKSTK